MIHPFILLLVRPLGAFQSQCCNKLENHNKLKIYALLTKREGKMAGYRPSSFFFLRFYGPRRGRGP